MTPGLRREPGPDLAAVGEDEALVARIRDEIRRDGPMPFARFMALALYDPDGGYYRSAAIRPGPAGDFVTAPELHPIFGATLSTLLVETWERLGRPPRFVVREHGAGTGTLALTILGALRADGSPLLDAIEVQPVEVEPRRLAALDERLRAAGFGDRLGTSDARDDDTIEGVILGNEVLDALPVHRVRQRGADLRELAVAIGDGGSLAEVEIDPTTPDLAARLDDEGVRLEDGQTAEICLAADDWVAAAARTLGRGLLVLIDYGAVAADLYDPRRRRDGTLRAYVAQRVHDDPYRHIGRQDLTAHVDITAVEATANRAGLVTIGITTQAEALTGLGIGERLTAIQRDPATDLETYLALRSSMMRLLDPSAMGRFRVMIFGRDWPDGPPLKALSFRLPERRRPTTPA